MDFGQIPVGKFRAPWDYGLELVLVQCSKENSFRERNLPPGSA